MPIASNVGSGEFCCHGRKVSAAPPERGGLAFAWGSDVEPLHHRTHSELAYRTFLELFNISRECGAARLENTSQKALVLERLWRQMILNLLINHRDRLKEESPDDAPCNRNI